MAPPHCKGYCTILYDANDWNRCRFSQQEVSSEPWEVQWLRKSCAPVGIFTLPIGHTVVRCIHTNLLGATKEVHMILNNTATGNDDQRDALNRALTNRVMLIQGYVSLFHAGFLEWASRFSLSFANTLVLALQTARNRQDLHWRVVGTDYPCVDE